jgi:hypothetical protein
LSTNGEFLCCFFHFMLPRSQVRVHNHVNRPPLLGGGHADCRFCKMQINASQGRTATEVCYRLCSSGIMATGFYMKCASEPDHGHRVLYEMCIWTWIVRDCYVVQHKLDSSVCFVPPYAHNLVNLCQLLVQILVAGICCSMQPRGKKQCWVEKEQTTNNSQKPQRLFLLGYRFTILGWLVV